MGIPKDLNVNAALNNVYHDAMVRSGGKKDQAERVKAQAAPILQELAGLAPKVREGDAGALKQAMKLVKSAGLSEDIMVPWLNEHVDAATMSKAGVDPQEVREKFEAFQDNKKAEDAETPEGPSQKAATMDFPKRV